MSITSEESLFEEESFDGGGIPDDLPLENSEKIDRTFPEEQTVRAHRQRYNGVWKEKREYKRYQTKDD